MYLQLIMNIYSRNKIKPDMMYPDYFTVTLI